MALRVPQWLTPWNEVEFNPKALQSKPEPHFYVFALDAATLKALTGIYRRSTKTGRPRAADPNVQRGHMEERSNEIRDFVQYGYPWCEMSDEKRRSSEFRDLRKPGWLPTAIVVNILRPDEERDGRAIAEDDLIDVEESDSATRIVLPRTYQAGKLWSAESLCPMEVIDGQHRLWAFEDFDIPGRFDLPVVAFHGLDRSWQAYLFWSINITPKRIKASLAFDLYPLLRTEEWLDRFHGHSIYRETRAQELVEALWSHPKSPWFHRINMLGEAGLKTPMVSQAAWVRSLMATYVKRWEGPRISVGGLFGAPLREDRPALPWNRAQQAAFLIAAGAALRDAVAAHKKGWAADLRKAQQSTLFEDEGDSAFYGRHTLLSTDQGIRGVLFVTNDLCFHLAGDLDLAGWRGPAKVSATDEAAVSAWIASLLKTKAISFLREIAEGMADYDWRSSSAPDLSESERLSQAVFRGSSGYLELRRQLLAHLAKGRGRVSRAAAEVRARLRL